MSLLDTCFTADHLHESFEEIRKSIHFKYNVQDYRINELREIHSFRQAYKDGAFSFSYSRPFRLCERGHERLIHPIVFRDRVVIHAFCKYVLIPRLTPYLIYDNCASQKGKGIDKSLDRMRVHLRRYYIENNTNEGYILQIDVSKYFDNLRHDIIIKQMSKYLSQEEMSFLKQVLKENEIDVSYMSDEEYKQCDNGVFNSLQSKPCNNGEKILYKSVGIGSEISQMIGLFYLHRIDNYIKIVRGIRFYARYMDDSYIIHPDKVLLKELLATLKDKYREVGLFINEKKTQIRRINKPVTFLKTVFILTESGKIIMYKCNDTFKRERRKLKKFFGKIPYEDVESQYKSWRGTVTRKPYKNNRQVKHIDELYNQLYGGIK